MDYKDNIKHVGLYIMDAAHILCALVDIQDPFSFAGFYYQSRIRMSGKALVSSDSGSGQSLAVKHTLVHFEVENILHGIEYTLTIIQRRER